MVALNVLEHCDTPEIDWFTQFVCVLFSRCLIQVKIIIFFIVGNLYF